MVDANASESLRRRRFSPWTWLVHKTSRVMAIAIVLAIVAALAGAAYALILARAEVTGSATSGTAALEFVDVGAVGIAADQAVYDVDGVTITSLSSLAAGVTATASVDGSGTLALDVSGLFPGEGVLFSGIDLRNASTLDLSGFVWDFNGSEFGVNGSAQTYEIYLTTFSGGAFNEVDPATFGTLAAGALAQGTNGYILVVEMPDTSTADGVAKNLAGVAIAGSNSR